jgi:hypothetical protein
MICTKKIGRISCSALVKSTGNGLTHPESVRKKIKKEPSQATI